MGWLVGEWGSYFLDLDLDIGVVHVGERSLVDLDLDIGVVHVGERSLVDLAS